ncbi:MAG: dTDP-4-dehydrorhamnose 3,5-epimerase [Bacteroidales bacterium]|jgi:dTDP-4-dehydrorhamnose 3,5-epimerase|nr:dTDP-4-dehydrorhamnose 3,5-epimerase [Bacteroidales bacterium]
MIIEETAIEGLLLITPDVFTDERGVFFESYNRQRWTEAGISDLFVQDNQSQSRKGVVRGLHFQKPPFAQSKLVRVLQGSVLDVAVDIRRNSPTYGQYISVLLSAGNYRQFFLPCGFAHGFVALEEDTLFAYKCSQFYCKEAEVAILYNDPLLKIDWGIDNPVVSEKDLQGIDFKNFISPFD